MQRRFPFTAVQSLALCMVLGPLAMTAPPEAGAHTEDATPPAAPGITVSLQQMQSALAQRFPLRYPVPGLLNLDVQMPRLQLLPEQNRIRTALDLQAAGPALQRSHQGVLEVDFALRYEASDRSIRAHQLRLQRLLFPTLQPGVVALLNGYAPALAEQSLLEVVLYRLGPKDLALADALGVQPGGITVTEAGLRIGWVSKPL